MTIWLFAGLVAFSFLAGAGAGLLGIGGGTLIVPFLAVGCLGALGALAGAGLALALPEDALRVALAIFLGIIGLRMARDGGRAMREHVHA